LKKFGRKIRIKKRKLSKIKKRKISKIIWKIIFSLVFSFGCLIMIMLSPLFRVRTIEIIGGIHTDERLLLEDIPIKLGDNWYSQTDLKLKDWFFKSHSVVEDQLVKEFPYIDEVRVALSLVGKLVIDIREREQKFLLIQDEKYWILDDEGILLQIVEPISRPNLPILENLNINTPILGNIIEFEEPFVMDKAKKYLKLVSKLQESLVDDFFPQVTSLDFSRLDNFSFVLDNRIRVTLSEVDDLTQYRVNFIKEIFYKKLDSKARGTLDFSGDSSEAVFSPN
jgi:cell division protein FtsQ